jgi:hypothetical protein
VTGGAASIPGDGRNRDVSAVIAATLQAVATVLVDGENVRRSVWPNMSREELEEQAHEWGRQHGHEVIVVWEGPETADDKIAADVRRLPPPLWVVTSDRELRERVADRTERIVGGGSFARELR